MYGYKFDNTINHPSFQFDLSKSHLYGVNPKRTFKKALKAFYNQI